MPSARQGEPERARRADADAGMEKVRHTRGAEGENRGAGIPPGTVPHDKRQGGVAPVQNHERGTGQPPCHIRQPDQHGNHELGQERIERIRPPGYQQPAEFYSPKYDTREEFESPTPDLSTTIYWNPGVQFSPAGEAVVEFYSADTPTTYRVTGEGVTTSGKLIQFTREIAVENRMAAFDAGKREADRLLSKDREIERLRQLLEGEKRRSRELELMIEEAEKKYNISIREKDDPG